MSTITTRSRYGLRFLVELARLGSSAPVDLGRVAKEQDISELYLSKLAVPLKAVGIIRSARGAKGGFELAKKAEDITLMAIVEALEGRRSLLACTADPGICKRSADCATLPIWRGLDAVITNYLSGITLAEVADMVPDYSI